jgi:type I restriction enzyme S subunit
VKEGWRIKLLGDVLRKTETVNPAAFPEVEFDYVDVSSVSNETFEIEATQRLKGKDAPSRARRLVRAKDVLFATIRPTLKRIAVTPDYLDGQVCSTGYFVMRPNDEIDSRFLFYYLFTEPFMAAMASLQKGASYPAVTDAEVRAQTIMFPPIGEQRRIVAILDEAFEGIATAKAHAERNLRNARATFESILETVYTDRVGEVPKERLEALCEQGRLITYGVIKLGDPIEGGVPCLRTSNVRWLSIDTNGMKRIAPSLSAEYSRTILRGGEVLVNVRGTLGGVAVVPDFMAGWNVSREVAVVPIGSLTLNPEYAAFWIGSRASQDWLSGVKKGAAYTGINIEDLRNVPVPVTSHDAQSQIVDDLKAARAATRKIEEIYSRKLAALDELKQSLLHQAFSGQL